MAVALKLTILFVINNVSVFSSYNSDMLLFVAQLVPAVVMFSLSVLLFYFGFTSSLHIFFISFISFSPCWCHASDSSPGFCGL